MTKIIENYIFDASAKTIEFTDYVVAGINLERVLVIVHAETHQIIYNALDRNLLGSVSGNILTIDFDTTALADSDPLLIKYDDPDYAQKVVLDSRIAGEDITNDWIRVLLKSEWTRITTATTTIIKSTSGYVVGIFCATPVASASMTLYNNTAGSGTIKGVITLPSTLLTSGLTGALMGGAACDTGITVVTTGTAEWWILTQ